MSELKARPTVYNGIPMRSRLEAHTAEWLDRICTEWEYEPGAFASEAGQYLPDFYCPGPWALIDGNEHGRIGGLFIEVRPTWEHVKGRWRRESGILRASHPEAWLLYLGWWDDPLTGVAVSPDAELITGVLGVNFTGHPVGLTVLLGHCANAWCDGFKSGCRAS